MNYTLRDLEHAEELQPLERIQLSAWGFSEREVVPASLMVASAHVGGIVVGAYLDNELTDEVVGFAFGFPALQDGRVWHHSHMLAIDPAHRASGLAVRLKLRQRERALDQGLTEMTWTFDPMLTRNARLNLGKLGAVAREYLPNWYINRSGIYAGLPADRLMISWDLRQPPIERGKRSPQGDFALRARDENLLLGPDEPSLTLDGPAVLIEMPRDLEMLKQHSPEIAREWRMATRTVFMHYLDLGYIVTDLVYEDERVFYLLEYFLEQLER